MADHLNAQLTGQLVRANTGRYSQYRTSSTRGIGECEYKKTIIFIYLPTNKPFSFNVSTFYSQQRIHGALRGICNNISIIYDVPNVFIIIL